MPYTRKTKDVYSLIWNGEEIDQFDTRKEAREMRKEYNLAFNGIRYNHILASNYLSAKDLR